MNDGRVIDLWNEGLPVNFEKPKLVSKTYRTQRWRKYLMNLQHDQQNRLRPHFAKYLAWKWNGQHSYQERVRRINMYFLQEETKSFDMELSPEKLLVYQFALR